MVKRVSFIAFNFTYFELYDTISKQPENERNFWKPEILNSLNITPFNFMRICNNV